MSDVYEHNVGDHEDPLPGPTWILGLLGSVLLAVVVLGVTALFFNADERMVSDKTMLALYPEFEALREEQMAKLQGPSRKVEVNENEKSVDTVVVPIEVAMQKFVERVAQAQSAAPAAPPSASSHASGSTP